MNGKRSNVNFSNQIIVCLFRRNGNIVSERNTFEIIVIQKINHQLAIAKNTNYCCCFGWEKSRMETGKQLKNAFL